MAEKSSSNFNQALWLGIGQLCTFAIAFLSAPILSRYFDKVEYATYRQILYVYTSLQALFMMGLPNVFAYFIPRLSIGQQKTLVNKLTKLFLLIGACFSLALYLTSDLIANLLNNPELSTGIKIFSPFPLFTLPTMGVEGIYTALRRTKEIAIYQVFSKIMMFLCIVLPVVIWNTGYREAVIGWGVASFITFLLAMYMKSAPYRNVEISVFSDLYRSVFRYSLPLMGAFIAGFFVNSADQFFISRYYGSSAFADFSNGCFNIPIIAMVAGSVRSVLVPLFSKAQTENRLSDAIESYGNAVFKMSIILLPIIAYSFFYSKEIMVGLFGAQYVGSGDYFQYYLIRNFFDIFPYFAILMAFGFTSIYMKMHVWGAFFIWGADFLIVFLGQSSLLIVLISSIFQIMCVFVAFSYIKRKSGLSLLGKKIVRRVFFILLQCFVTLILLDCLWNSFFSQCNVYYFLFTTIIAYYVLLIFVGHLTKINYMEPIFILLKRK